MAEGTEKTIFLNALDEESDEAREVYLRAACGTDQTLRASVDSLLAAHLRLANPLDVPVVGPATNRVNQSTFTSMVCDVGRVIGPYRLMEQIGEGGFGLVYVAQQEHPVKRMVALKIIKPGTGSKEILARFDAERQAVAMMSHPNIAQIFDAGVTDDARPFFVMELVRGVPITDFCEQQPLSLQQRIELFVDVCAATHHAHQKGVIHRDIKPTNVLVTLHDHKPVVKVIDFGVAKAVGQSLTDQTIYTRFYSMIGTPLYMSPEQAAMSGLDVDTRSDIYSLGVLLYQLLTGTTPFDRERMNTAAYDEVRRIIREEDPPKPSTRLTETQNANSSTIAGNRTSRLSPDPTKYRHESIPNDLDWIVMKSLEKDRQRRYESAAAMADDLRRFLRQEPIEARPPTRRYRLAKFSRRNRMTLMTGGLVASALIVGMAASLYQASIAISQRNEKEIALRDAIEARNSANEARQEVEQFAERLKTANSLLGDARANEESQQFREADQSITTAIELVPNYYLVWVERARLRAKLHLWGEAADDFAAALQLGAPANTNQWNGAAALFLIHDRQADYQAIYDHLMINAKDNPAESDDPKAEHDADNNLMNWIAIRSCLLVPASLDDARSMARRADLLLSRRRINQGPPNRRNDPPGRPPDFLGDTLRPLLGFPPGPPPGQGNSSLGPPPERPDDGGARPEDRLPWGVRQYLAGWAHLRAGDTESAIRYLVASMRDRDWPNANMSHVLLAIAHYQAGHLEQAQSELLRTNEVITQLASELQLPPTTQYPWFDLVELIILHREATILITGQPPVTDPQIENAQTESGRVIFDR